MIRSLFYWTVESPTSQMRFRTGRPSLCPLNGSVPRFLTAVNTTPFVNLAFSLVAGAGGGRGRCIRKRGGERRKGGGRGACSGDGPTVMEAGSTTSASAIGEEWRGAKDKVVVPGEKRRSDARRLHRSNVINTSTLCHASLAAVRRRGWWRVRGESVGGAL